MFTVYGLPSSRVQIRQTAQEEARGAAVVTLEYHSETCAPSVSAGLALNFAAESCEVHESGLLAQQAMVRAARESSGISALILLAASVPNPTYPAKLISRNEFSHSPLHH